MTTIQLVNLQRFSCNGIQYFKNFISRVEGNRITIYNAYDSRDELVSNVLFSQLSLNGVIYPNVVLLQQNLLPVIFNRDTLGFGSSLPCNLSYLPSATDGTILNDVGTSAIIPLADSTNAGLMSPQDKDKLNDLDPNMDLDDVLGNGNSSFQSANVGLLGLWDSFASAFSTYLIGDKFRFSFYTANNLIARLSSSAFTLFSNGLAGTLLQNALTANRTYTLRDKSGTVAFLEDFDADGDFIVDKAGQMVTIGRNSTGQTLRKGTVVYISGSTGNVPNFVKAQANSEQTSAGTFGVLSQDIPNNSNGTAVTVGTINNLNTNNSGNGNPHPFTNDLLSDGDKLYLDPNTAGYVTIGKPYAPNHMVYVATVVRTHPNLGTIVVRIQNGFELDELHDVDLISNPPSDFEVLAQENGLWKNKTIESLLGFKPADRATYLYDRFMTNHYSYMLPLENGTYSTLRINTASMLTVGTVSSMSENPTGVRYQTSTAVGSIAGTYGAPFGNNLTIGTFFGFEFIRKFKVISSNNEQRIFIGLSFGNHVNPPTNVAQNTLLNCFGIAKFANDPWWYFIWNDNTGGANNYPVSFSGDMLGTDTNCTWKLRITKNYGVLGLVVELTRIDAFTGDIKVYQFGISSDFNTSVFYNPIFWIGNSTVNTGAVSIKDIGTQLFKRNQIGA